MALARGLLVLVIGIVGGWLLIEATGFLVVAFFTTSSSHVSYTSPVGAVALAFAISCAWTVVIAMLIIVTEPASGSLRSEGFPFLIGWFVSLVPFAGLGFGIAVVDVGAAIPAVQLVEASPLCFPGVYYLVRRIVRGRRRTPHGAAGSKAGR